MRLKPVNDKIVVKPKNKEDEHITESGLILPDTIEDGGLLEGKVLAAGNGMYSSNGSIIPLAVETGDVILYNKHAAVSEHTIDGETIIIMSQNEVMSIVKEKE